MGRMRSLLIPGVDKKLLVRDAAKSMPDLTRRRFISGGASLGALTLLTGCDITDSFSAEEMLKQVSKFNDAVQAAIFNSDAMAPTCAPSPSDSALSDVAATIASIAGWCATFTR